MADSAGRGSGGNGGGGRGGGRGRRRGGKKQGDKKAKEQGASAAGGTGGPPPSQQTASGASTISTSRPPGAPSNASGSGPGGPKPKKRRQKPSKQRSRDKQQKQAALTPAEMEAKKKADAEAALAAKKAAEEAAEAERRRKLEAERKAKIEALQAALAEREGRIKECVATLQTYASTASGHVASRERLNPDTGLPTIRKQFQSTKKSLKSDLKKCTAFVKKVSISLDNSYFFVCASVLLFRLASETAFAADRLSKSSKVGTLLRYLLIVGLCRFDSVNELTIRVIHDIYYASCVLSSPSHVFLFIILNSIHVFSHHRPEPRWCGKIQVLQRVPIQPQRLLRPCART